MKVLTDNLPDDYDKLMKEWELGEHTAASLCRRWNMDDHVFYRLKEKYGYKRTYERMFAVGCYDRGIPGHRTLWKGMATSPEDAIMKAQLEGVREPDLSTRMYAREDTDPRNWGHYH